MAGLLTKRENIIHQWFKLFKSQDKMRSLYAQQHWKKFVDLGLPTCQYASWKYTFLDILLSQKFVLPIQIPKLSQDEISKYALSIDAIRLVFIDGHFELKLSTSDTDLFVIEHNVNADYSFLPEPIQPEAFLHLTESLAEKIIHIRLKRDSIAMRPLYLLHISSGQTDAINTVHYRHHIELEENTNANVIEHYVTLNTKSHFTGARFTFKVADHACLNHIKLTFQESNSYHFAHNDVVVSCNAKVNSSCFFLGSAFLRHNTSVQLNGENTQLSLNSFALPINSELADIRTYLEHNKGYCQSRQVHKTISCHQAHSVFNGHIKVGQYALKTDSQMINNNLLLGHLSEVNTKPQLEIYADDVKCSHGATVGCIDNEQIFYLRSRGIAEHAAKKMIIHAFSTDITDILDDEMIRKIVIASINKRFLGIKL
ncbi:Fe-S cluster assembly protein SufD [Candidatus Pantoea carbekii]|uniref:SufD protein n=1 Tax=Candidatus Pantoea carbekii TaxID=1235990 RepID=U3U8E5_9GAMM|nr:Fe-S cluster assembly protein SufD [Candidatus Pantoea carbekii]AKC32098.1 permease component of ABC-type transport system involved in Fe-S cluster assembly SufD [Candidatus Pantoea carbekii]BAO00624.1 SufD protein [Candidatus Pantoea carbekii]